MKLADIYLSLKSDLQYIEKELEKAITTKDRVLHTTSSHLLKAGGKRIRPVFVLLSGKFGNYQLEKLKSVAVALELIHMASLVHDDVIDDARTRRGQPTVKAKWDNRLAMYTGDYILAEALLNITELHDPRVHQILSRSIVQMTIGEIEQIRNFNRYNQNLRHYLKRIKRKTALLIAVSCHLGAIVAGTPENGVRALFNYGYHVGMAFQITDDILDFTGNEKTLGKPAGSDLRQGNITLPAIYCLHHPKYASELHSLLSHEGDAGIDEDSYAKAIQLIRSSEGIDCARELAARYIDKALMWLEELPDGRNKQSLIEIARLIGERNY